MDLVSDRAAAAAGPFKSDLEFQLLSQLPAAAYTCDRAGLITYYNLRAEELWGRAPVLNDPTDRFCGSFRLYDADGTSIRHDQCWMARALNDQQQYNGCEIIVERPDGQRRTVLAHANPFRSAEGQVLGAVNVLVDITDRKSNEELLRDADRRKTEFLAMLAHELRNPLAPLRNGLQILRIAYHDTETLEQARSMMERQIGQMVRLIDDLLDISRISSGKIELRKERIDITAAVQDAIETSRPLLEEYGHHLHVEFPSQPVYVEADRTRLAQVFVNLLNNSARYTDRGGQISLVVERHGSDVIVRVRDNGVGISREMLPKIFEMYAQVDNSLEQSKGGLGIGLSLVRGLVELHGGRVEAESDGPGKGSEFIVRLSVVLPPNRAKQDEEQQSTLCSSGCRILVVDDNRDAALSMAMMLKISGHETKTAYDGLEALALAESFKPQVVLLDLGLPKLDGFECCRRLREMPTHKNTVIIAVSGWGQEEDKRRSREVGFNFHMVKPLDPVALEKFLAGLLLTPE